MSLYVEISGRMTLKTTRLINAANDQKGKVVIVCTNEHMVSYIGRRAKTPYIITSCELTRELRSSTGSVPGPREARYFFDDFDFYLTGCPIYTNGYYVTTPKRLREDLRSKEDPLIVLAKKAGNALVNRVNPEWGRMFKASNGATSTDAIYLTEGLGVFLRPTTKQMLKLMAKLPEAEPTYDFYEPEA